MLQMVRDVYRLVFGHWRLVFRFGGVLALLVLGLMLTTPYVLPQPAAADELAPETAPWLLLLGLLSMLLMVWLAVSCAVRWHRFALYGEQPPVTLGAEFGRRGWIYLWQSIVIGMLSLAAMLPLLLIGGGGVGGPGSIVLAAAAVVVWMYLLARLGPTLPAVAADRPMRLAESWRATRGHGGAFTFLLLLTTVPPSLAVNLLASLPPLQTPEPAPMALSGLLSLTGLLFSTALGAAALSRCYIAIYGLPAPAAPTA